MDGKFVLQGVPVGKAQAILLATGFGLTRSAAYEAYQGNRKDIERLLEIHSDVGGDKAGRKWGLEVLNKSGVVLICSFWEAYCEDLAAECLRHLVDNAKGADVLPNRLLRAYCGRRSQLVARHVMRPLARWSMAR